MKRKISFLLMLAILMGASTVLCGCGDALKTDVLLQLTANITDATGIGIEESPSAATTKTARSFGLQVYADGISEELMLVKQKENQEKELVKFVNDTAKTIKADGIKVKPGESIEQGELNAKINKLYVDTYHNMTYIQFVPKDTTTIPKAFVRPNDLEYDENGVTAFDTLSYFTTDSIKSYVIDNATGKVYPIVDLFLMRIADGLVHTWDGFLCDAKIQNGNLVFTSYFANRNIQPTRFFRDKYNNVYIENQSYEAIDRENKVVFFTQGYYKAQNGEVVYFDYEDSKANQSMGMDLTVTKIQKVTEDLTLEAIDNTESYDFNSSVNTSLVYSNDAGFFEDSTHESMASVIVWRIDDGNPLGVSHIANGYAYFYRNVYSGYGADFLRVDTTTYEKKSIALREQGSHYFALDYNTVLKTDNDQGKIGKIFYMILDFDRDYETEYDHVDYIKTEAQDWTLLQENCLWNPKESETNYFPDQDSLDRFYTYALFCRGMNSFTVDTATAKQVYQAQIKHTEGGKSVEMITVEDVVLNNKKEYVLQPIH